MSVTLHGDLKGLPKLLDERISCPGCSRLTRYSYCGRMSCQMKWKSKLTQGELFLSEFTMRVAATDG